MWCEINDTSVLDECHASHLTATTDALLVHNNSSQNM